MFLGIGHIPNTHEFDRLTANEQGYMLVDEPSTATNLAGVFACGDVIDLTYRQAVTAAGTGCRAALDAERYLRGFPLPPELHWGVSAIDAA